MLTLETVLSAQKSQLGTAFGATAKVFEGVEQLARLHLQTCRATLDDCAAACRTALVLSEPQQLAALPATSLEPLAARWTAYAGQVWTIVSATGTQLRELAGQSAAEAQGQFATALDAALADAPAGSESATAMVKSAVAAANSALQNVQDAWRQASEAADAQVGSMTAGLAQGAQKAA